MRRRDASKETPSEDLRDRPLIAYRDDPYGSDPSDIAGTAGLPGAALWIADGRAASAPEDCQAGLRGQWGEANAKPGRLALLLWCGLVSDLPGISVARRNVAQRGIGGVSRRRTACR